MYTSHAGKITAKIEENFKDAVMLLGVEATKVISQPRFWEGFDVRDIVDTGQLRASQGIRFQITKSALGAEITYRTNYAAAVHNGATIRYPNGTVRRIPPRRWMDEAAKRTPIEDILGRL